MTKKNHQTMFDGYLDSYLKNKSPDCILYSQDCGKFKIFKELFCQTDFMRKILLSTKEFCCGTLEIICPCSTEELGHLIYFLKNGEIHYRNDNDCTKIQENLCKIFGFPEELDSSRG